MLTRRELFLAPIGLLKPSKLSDLQKEFDEYRAESDNKFKLIGEMFSIIAETADSNTKLFDSRLNRLENFIFPDILGEDEMKG